MLDFILNKLFVKRVIKDTTQNRTYIRKEVGERKTPTLREKFVIESKKTTETELSNYFVDCKGLNISGREKNNLITCNKNLK